MINLETGEKVIYEIRRHWYILLRESVTILFLSLIPLILIIGFGSLDASFSVEEEALFTFIAAAWVFSLWVTFVIIWTNYYLDVWVVTDKRIIDVEQYHLFSRDVSEFRLDRIQDVTIEIKGLLPTILRFGDIHVQTAGESRDFVIRHIPEPYKIKDIIINSQNRAVAEARGVDGH